MLGSFFRRKKPPPETQAPKASFDAIGIHYPAPAGSSAAAWLAAPHAFPAVADLGARLAQIVAEGLGICEDTAVVLTWDEVYTLLRHPDFGPWREALQIPPQSDARPRLVSTGALIDADFAVLADGWVDAAGRPLRPAPRPAGRVLHGDAGAQLLPEGIHQLLDELARFHATPVANRTLPFKELFFGRLRKLAIAAGCPVSDYLSRTIVLTAERLRLQLRRHGAGDASVLEIIPDFDGAPAGWLSLFDRLPVQRSYDVPEGPALARVIIAPEVATVLAAIKRMAGRRAAGARAQAFVRNPFAVLGEAARAVMDPDEFERARDDAGIAFETFTPHVERTDTGEVVCVGLLIESLGATAVKPPDEWIDSIDELARFTDTLSRCLDDDAPCVSWRGRELEITGDTPDELARLQGWLHEWRRPTLWTADEVLDLGSYSERVEAIGSERPFITPVIARKDGGAGWFEGNAEVGIRMPTVPGQDPAFVPLDFEDIPSLQAAVDAAQAQGRNEVHLPGLTVPVPLADARMAVGALANARAALSNGSFRPTGDAPRLEPHRRLVIKRNLEEIDYSEARAESLHMPEGHAPRLPASLRPEVRLKPHQESGIAWLQHLWSASPHQCRGTILADDMGLGKTLQLLCFIAESFERDPALPPALIVAPVALLENWRNEIDRFFQPGALPFLMLYGDSLKALRAGRDEVDVELRAQGITRLLKKNWIGSARLVLTTYETLRDLEFAMAARSWSIMVCDEAQKIKTPAAMVTRSAKKQKVRFRIACTGTPVENSLADLWCLFDFVQPGLLGALNHFSRTYRQPIEARTEAQRAKVEELREVIRPQILHRKKIEVARDLPVPVEYLACKQLPMSPYQSGLYEAALASLRAQRAGNPSAQLQALLAIRQICSDPHGHAEADVQGVAIARLLNESPKMGWLVERLRTLARDPAGQHKVIIFCEFRELQLTIQRVVASFFGFAPAIVNGDTSADPRVGENRQRLIDAFQRKDGFNVIILSPVAVGFGVNIQAANHVVHFTRTWNPAKEDQATARAWRIGQQRTVTVYHPGVVSEDFPSFDVRLDALLTRKRELAADMLNGSGDLRAADFADFG
ncbi:DEAD/DEAH box helicase [Variovorax robiniae]|uniref:DEAD/DEAH box helicase n=1 Tax=Variovorax robiniae TaxID=1836199 RepID=A0ABU8XFI4_9BURK